MLSRSDNCAGAPVSSWLLAERRSSSPLRNRNGQGAALDTQALMTMLTPMSLVGQLLRIYSLVVLVSVIGSWVGGASGPLRPVFEFADRLTEPVLRPIREKLPAVGGFDLSPLLLMVVLGFLARLFGA
jgi:YggT family protein